MVCLVRVFVAMETNFATVKSAGLCLVYSSTYIDNAKLQTLDFVKIVSFSKSVSQRDN